jgi:integrase
MSALPPKADITGRGLDVRFVHLPDKYRPLLLTAIFTGLRASELRGLRWEDVDLPHAKLHVRQRADRYNKIDKPKSESSERTVPLTPMVVNTLREWKLRCPKGEHGKLEFVFPTGTGEIEYHSNIAQRGLAPALIAAGIVTKDGKPKYPAYIRCATSMRRGASIALKMAV